MFYAPGIPAATVTVTQTTAGIVTPVTVTASVEVTVTQKVQHTVTRTVSDQAERAAQASSAPDTMSPS